MTQLVNNLPAMQETWVQPLGQEDPLEMGMATHYSILAWRIPWTEEPRDHKESDTTEQLTHNWDVQVYLFSKGGNRRQGLSLFHL